MPEPMTGRRSSEKVYAFAGMPRVETGMLYLDPRALLVGIVPAVFLFDGLVKHDCKSLVLSAYHRAHDAGLCVECKNRKPKADALPMFNCSPAANVDAAGTHVFDRIPIGSGLDGVFGGEKGGTSWISASF